MPNTLPPRVRLAGYEFHLKTGELSGGGQIVRLAEKPFRVLLILVEGGGEEKAIETYSEWVRTYPDDPRPHANLGVLYTELGRYEKAALEMQERIRLSPEHADYNLIGVYACLNRLDDAQALLEQARKQPGASSLHEPTYSLAFLRGDNAVMQEQLAWAMGKTSVEGRFLSAQGDTEAYFGRLAHARQLSEEAVRPFRVDINMTFRGFWLICIAAIMLAAAPIAAQTQFQGQIISNTVGIPVTLASPVYYAETVTALTTVAPSNMACSTYPVAQVRLKRSGTDSSIGSVFIGPGTSLASGIAIPSLQVGDVVYGMLSVAGVGCTHELPIQISFTAQYVANVSANLTNLASGASGANAFLRMRLQNCGTNNPQVTGTSIVLAYQQDFMANSQGQVSGTVYGNDKITCGGAQPSVYEVSFYVNQVRVGVPKLYSVCTYFPEGGCSNSTLTFDPSTATAIDPSPPPAISPFGYIYSRNIGSQTITQAPYTSLNIFGNLHVSNIVGPFE